MKQTLLLCLILMFLNLNAVNSPAHASQWTYFYAGDWHSIPDDLFQKLAALPEVEEGVSVEANDRVLQLKLPWYKDALLIRVIKADRYVGSFTGEDSDPIFFFLIGQDGTIQYVDGTTKTITDFNRANLPRINQENADAYLMFCTYLVRDQGGFFALKAKGRYSAIPEQNILSLAYDSDAEADEAYKLLTESSREFSCSPSEEHYICEGTGLNRGAMYFFTYRLFPDGQVKRISAKAIGRSKFFDLARPLSYAAIPQLEGTALEKSIDLAPSRYSIEKA